MKIKTTLRFHLNTVKMVKINHKIQVQEWIWGKGYTYLLLERVHTSAATMEIRIYIYSSRLEKE